MMIYEWRVEVVHMICAALKHRGIFSRSRQVCYAPILLIRLDYMLLFLNSLK